MSIKQIDKFIKIVNNTIDNGNVTLLEKAIKKYKNKIPIKYISSANIILDELLVEKMESLLIYTNLSIN